MAHRGPLAVLFGSSVLLRNFERQDTWHKVYGEGGNIVVSEDGARYGKSSIVQTQVQDKGGAGRDSIAFIACKGTRVAVDRGIIRCPQHQH